MEEKGSSDSPKDEILSKREDNIKINKSITAQRHSNYEILSSMLSVKFLG